MNKENWLFDKVVLIALPQGGNPKQAIPYAGQLWRMYHRRVTVTGGIMAARWLVGRKKLLRDFSGQPVDCTLGENRAKMEAAIEELSRKEIGQKFSTKHSGDNYV